MRWNITYPMHCHIRLIRCPGRLSASFLLCSSHIPATSAFTWSISPGIIHSLTVACRQDALKQYIYSKLPVVAVMHCSGYSNLDAWITYCNKISKLFPHGSTSSPSPQTPECRVLYFMPTPELPSTHTILVCILQIISLKDFKSSEILRAT